MLAVLEAGAGAARERLRGALAAELRALETLAGHAAVPVDAALALLLELEWAGIARAAPGQRWSRG